ncbi:hypothetical protein Scep_008386 [Stephania cephalantha]|uniref:Nuclear pore complex protein NUP1 n=1 Tax=Stephania cephalantha TaxID=152367 RepID=A0AAP0KDJ5_9MAGN
MERDEGEERGGGGKLRRPPRRKPSATPYDRPQSQPQKRGGGGGWWLSKLVDPAARVIAGGATKFFPSLFPRPHPPLLASSISDVEHQDLNLDVDAEPEQVSDVETDNEKIQIYRRDEGENVTKEPERQRAVSIMNQHDGESTSAATGMSEIEKMVEGKTFSREDLHRLTEILYSRMVDQLDADNHGKEVNMHKREETGVHLLGNQNINSLGLVHEADSGMISSPVPQNTFGNEGGSSPVEIAKAYMRNQVSEFGLCSPRAVERDEQTPLPRSVTTDGSPSHRPSPCWPGAMIQDPPAYMTPQTERHGVRLHNLPRTPYSRTVFSRSASKLHESGDRFLNTSSVKRKRLQTPIYGVCQARTSRVLLDNDSGTVGPIRRVHHKFGGITTPSKGPDTFDSLLYGHLPTESSERLLPTLKQKVEPRASTSRNFSLTSSKPHSGVSAVHPQSTDTAKKILEHLDRTILTPQKKMTELKLATSWRRTSSELAAIPTSPQTTHSHVEGSSSHQANDVFGQKSSTRDKEVATKSMLKNPLQEGKTDETTVAANTDASTSNTISSMIGSGPDSMAYNVRPLINFRKTPDFQTYSHEASGGEENAQTEKNRPLPLQKQVDQRDTSGISSSGNGSRQTFGNKPSLPSIFVAKHGSKAAVPLDNGSFCFSFPVAASSGALSEPPTPSIMPSSSSGSLPRPQENATAPSYSFGSKTSDRLTFAFPSISSSAPIDTSTPVFTFGSNENARISFRSVGKDAICY